MKTNLKNIKYHIDSHHHGLFVKEARLRQGYRLAEVAKEICDISYLSKIESGTLVPSLDIFWKIAERLEIQFPSKERMCPKDFFRKALYQENMKMIESYLAIDTCHHYEIQLIEFFRAVVKGNLIEACNLKKNIDQFRHHFHPKEEQTYLLFSGIYFFKNFEWKQGEACFKKSLSLIHQLGEEDPYLYFELANYYFQLQKTFLGFSYLERATMAFKKIFEKAWVFKCEILWCRELMKHGDVKSVEMKLEALKQIMEPCQSHLQWNSFFNVLGMIYEKRGQYIQAEECYTRSMKPHAGKINEMFIIDTIKFHYGRQNRDQLIKLIEGLDLTCLSTRGRLLADFYYFKMTDDRSEHFENFLRKDAMPFARKNMDYDSVNLYTKELTNYYRYKSSHKKVADAYYKWEQFCNELNSIEKI